MRLRRNDVRTVRARLRQLNVGQNLVYKIVHVILRLNREFHREVPESRKTVLFKILICAYSRSHNANT